MFLKTDYNRLLSYLISNDKQKIFFDATKFRQPDNTVPLILSSVYNVKSLHPSGGNLLFLEKKQANPKAPSLITRSSGDILYENFDLQLSERLKYSFGQKGSLSLGKRFLIEIIFKPSTVPVSVYSSRACVLSNKNDSAGFVLEQMEKSPSEYAFVIGKKGIVLNIMPDKWNYLALEVDGRKIRAYINGKIDGPYSSAVEYKESQGLLYVGNYNLMESFFFGDIKELRISRQLIDEKQSRLVWDKTMCLN